MRIVPGGICLVVVHTVGTPNGRFGIIAVGIDTCATSGGKGDNEEYVQRFHVRWGFELAEWAVQRMLLETRMVEASGIHRVNAARHARALCEAA